MPKPEGSPENPPQNEDPAPAARVKDSEETRRRLLVAACDAFSDRGYLRGNLRDISKAAGVNVALVKRYFGNKEGLYEQALHSIIDPEILLPQRREDYGEYMSDLLVKNPVATLRMMIASMNSPEANEISLKRLRNDIYEPLIQWLGHPHAEDRAMKILMICSGFVIHNRLLPVEGAANESIRKWLAETLQSLVDEGSH